MDLSCSFVPLGDFAPEHPLPFQAGAKHERSPSGGSDKCSNDALRDDFIFQLAWSASTAICQSFILLACLGFSSSCPEAEKASTRMIHDVFIYREIV